MSTWTRFSERPPEDSDFPILVRRASGASDTVLVGEPATARGYRAMAQFEWAPIDASALPSEAPTVEMGGFEWRVCGGVLERRQPGGAWSLVGPVATARLRARVLVALGAMDEDSGGVVQAAPPEPSEHWDPPGLGRLGEWVFGVEGREVVAEAPGARWSWDAGSAPAAREAAEALRRFARWAEMVEMVGGWGFR